MDYQRKSNEILEKRNAYYKRRKKLVTSVSLSLAFVTIFISGYFSFLGLSNLNKQSNKDYFYQTIEIKATSSNGVSNFYLSNLEKIEEVVNIINQSYKNSSNENIPSVENKGPENEMDNFIEEQIDYLLKITDKNGKVANYCVTSSSILSEQLGNVSSTRDNYIKLKNLLLSN